MNFIRTKRTVVKNIYSKKHKTEEDSQFTERNRTLVVNKELLEKGKISYSRILNLLDKKSDILNIKDIKNLYKS